MSGQAEEAGVRDIPPCDCRANDWIEGDCGAIRCDRCGGYAGEPGTSIRLAAASDSRRSRASALPRVREIVPVTLTEAKRFVWDEHRHNNAPVGWKFGVGLGLNGRLVGVAMVGRPCSQELAGREPRTVEITRCTTTGERNACSQLYGAACRMAKAGGYLAAITYTLESEDGASLSAAGFTREAYVPHEETHRVGRYVTNLFGEVTRPAEGKWRWRRVLVTAQNPHSEALRRTP